MNIEKVEVILWSDDKVPDEALLRSILADEELDPYVWSNGPGDVYGAHDHPYHKVIYVVRGSITFGLPDAGDKVTLNSGDRLELPAGVRHDAVVGSRGVACLEAHR
ncbi:MAG: cupin domain-containing protein [Deltaproteobacteria bacterium]|jgi:quercetin dioxygenase-like cupin family protein|nr:cupin domain-containing protein [Deltaproteobacteria bacterium]